MRSSARSLVLVLVGVMLLQVVISGRYIAYVRPWIQAPLVLCGVLVLAAGVVTELRPRPDDGAVSRIGWLVFLPVLVALVARPPALGDYTAQHQGQRPPPQVPLPKKAAHGPTPMTIAQFTGVAAYDGSGFLDGLPVRLVGFTSYDGHGGWDLTRLTIRCCAADALASQTRVIGAPPPPRNTWVELVGTWVDPHTKAPRLTGTPEIRVASMHRIEAPKDPYEY